MSNGLVYLWLYNFITHSYALSLSSRQKLKRHTYTPSYMQPPSHIKNTQQLTDTRTDTQTHRHSPFTRQHNMADQAAIKLLMDVFILWREREREREKPEGEMRRNKKNKNTAADFLHC